MPKGTNAKRGDWLEEPTTNMEYPELFAEMGIGRGIMEYERGQKDLKEFFWNKDEYDWAIKALAEWCEV